MWTDVTVYDKVIFNYSTLKSCFSFLHIFCKAELRLQVMSSDSTWENWVVDSSTRCGQQKRWQRLRFFPGLVFMNDPETPRTSYVWDVANWKIKRESSIVELCWITRWYPLNHIFFVWSLFHTLWTIHSAKYTGGSYHGQRIFQASCWKVETDQHMSIQ